MKSIFEKINVHQKMNLPFVIYRKPDSKTLIGIFQNDDHLYFTENFSEKGFVFTPFSGASIIFPLDKSEIKFSIAHFDKHFKEKKTEQSDSIALQESELKKEEFISLVKKGVNYIEQGECDKIVLSRNEKISLESFNLEVSFEKMIYKYPQAFCYTWYHPKIGLWMGATPETLFSVQGSKIKTMALAGTQLDQNNDEIDWGAKEKKEQHFVTQFIVNKLKDEVEEIILSAPYTVKAGKLLHIKTDISGTLKSKNNLKQIIESLHPTPAVCGLPKEVAKLFIEKHEDYDRTFYSGFLGEINHDFALNENSTDLYVNLRCMNIDKQNAYLYVGCGITKESIPEFEWIETINKLKTMQEIL